MSGAWLQFLQSNWPDILAFVSGALGVWLTIRQNIWCWPVSLVSVVISLIIFFKQRLYGDMSLQVVYFFAGLYGWFFWNENRKRDFVVKRTDTTQVPWLIVFTLLHAVGYYFLLAHFGGDKPVLDALLTAGSLTATYMMTKKWVGNWLLWVIIDATYILLYGLKHMWWFCLLYGLFTVMAFYGWIKWRKQAS